jgi:hypothetical protein
MTEATAVPTAKDWKDLHTIIERANRGDQKAIRRLRQFLDKYPQVWQHLGNLARVSERAWIDLISGGDVLAAESVRRHLAHVRQQLVGETSNVVEQLLVDQVTATWLEVAYMQTASADIGGRSLTQAGLYLKRLESAQRRHLNAVKQLVQIRKLLPGQDTIPELQIYPYGRETA